MAATLTVERIDIFEGPNLDSLLEAFKFAAAHDQLQQALESMVGKGLPQGITGRFEHVAFFGEDGQLLLEMGQTFYPIVVGVSYLGNEANSSTRIAELIYRTTDTCRSFFVTAILIGVEGSKNAS
jgi:hypothetical protein